MNASLHARWPNAPEVIDMSAPSLGAILIDLARDGQIAHDIRLDSFTTVSGAGMGAVREWGYGSQYDSLIARAVGKAIHLMHGEGILAPNNDECTSFRIA